VSAGGIVVLLIGLIMWAHGAALGYLVGLSHGRRLRVWWRSQARRWLSRWLP
jgi:hypothetical protein